MRQLISSNGTDYIAFAVTGILVLIISLIYVWWLERSAGKLSCPGLNSNDKDLGNLGAITKQGGLHQFLLDNHKKLGPIFSFYWGKDVAVSIASPAYFKDVVTLFDRAVEPFEIFKPLIGPKSLQFMNTPEGQKHRKIHDRHYSFTAIKSYLEIFCDVGEELVKKWRTITKGEHIPLAQHMLVVAVKSIVKSSFGMEYFKSNGEILQIQEAYHFCWDDMEERIQGNIPEPGSERLKKFEENITFLREKVKGVIAHRRASKERTNNLLDTLLEEDELYPTDDHFVDMIVTYLIGGFHTTGYLLSWTVYFLCLNPDVEQKVYEEIMEVVGDEELTIEHCKQLSYMEKVINESLRCSVLAPFATRCSEYDLKIGDHVIPKNTQIVTALGVVLQDPVIWPEPKKFNPDRFNADQVKLRHPLAFQPFGFAGKRKCPGYRFAYYEAYVFLTSIIKNFKVELVKDQDISFRHGLVTQFTDEVWITAEARTQ